MALDLEACDAAADVLERAWELAEPPPLSPELTTACVALFHQLCDNEVEAHAYAERRGLLAGLLHLVETYALGKKTAMLYHFADNAVGILDNCCMDGVRVRSVMQEQRGTERAVRLLLELAETGDQNWRSCSSAFESLLLFCAHSLSQGYQRFHECLEEEEQWRLLKVALAFWTAAVDPAASRRCEVYVAPAAAALLNAALRLCTFDATRIVDFRDDAMAAVQLALRESGAASVAVLEVAAHLLGDAPLMNLANELKAAKRRLLAWPEVVERRSAPPPPPSRLRQLVGSLLATLRLRLLA
jgi:hypothetical protein